MIGNRSPVLITIKRKHLKRNWSKNLQAEILITNKLFSIVLKKCYVISACRRTPGVHSIEYVVWTVMTFSALLTTRKQKDYRRRKT